MTTAASSVAKKGVEEVAPLPFFSINEFMHQKEKMLGWRLSWKIPKTRVYVSLRDYWMESFLVSFLSDAHGTVHHDNHGIKRITWFR